MSEILSRALQSQFYESFHYNLLIFYPDSQIGVVTALWWNINFPICFHSNILYDNICFLLNVSLDFHNNVYFKLNGCCRTKTCDWN